MLEQINIDHSRLFERSTIADVEGSANDYARIAGFINQSSMSAVAPPEYLPVEIDQTFREGANCLTISAWNAASAMFRLCLDLATEPLLPREDETCPNPPNGFVRRNLGPRIEWLINNNRLPRELESLAECIREDGNDGVHRGTLSENDAVDLLDFTIALLERRYTEPKRLSLAEERRAARRERPR